MDIKQQIQENRDEICVADGKARFLASHTLQNAVLRNLQTMIESAQRLSDDLKVAHPEIELSK